jgi:hypothetical protein
MAALDCRFKGWARPLAHEAQLLFGPRALHPQHEAIIELSGILEAVIINT